MGMEVHTKLAQTSEGQSEESWAELPDGGKFERKALRSSPTMARC